MNDLDLSERLATSDHDLLGRPDLTAIRAEGRRRRRVRRTAAVAASALGVAAVVGGASLLGVLPGGESGPRVTTYTAADAPRGLTPLTRRVLDEVAGAEQVSPGQVVVPAPQRGQRWLGPDLDPSWFAGDLVPLGAHLYDGVTLYPPTAFPAWLWDEVDRIEREELGDDNGHPVGSTAMGVLVDGGEAYLGCVAKDMATGEASDGPCFPAIVGRSGDRTHYEWGMGTDDFLEPGKEMELFTSDDYSSGSPSILWIGGLDGTDTARVVFEMGDGTTVDAEVMSGTLVPDDTMFWANLPGVPTSATAYDAAGDVIDDHPIQGCSGGVDCEVR